MKNVIPYKENCFDVHKKAVEKKHAGELKQRLLNLNANVETEFNLFLEKFELNQLAALIPSAQLGLSKEDLLTLYSYQSSVIISVRNSIRKLQVKTIISTCQNCTIDSANSFDHILPKAKYPEFVVNPKNLFPCCSTCNSYKLASTNNGATPRFLNLYLDDLPNEQYLFVDIAFDVDGSLDFEFRLENVENKINPALFLTIESHFKHLHLFERMKIKSIEYISELETRIGVFKNQLTIEVIVENLINAVVIDKGAYGENHWRCILELSLLQNNPFIDKFR